MTILAIFRSPAPIDSSKNMAARRRGLFSLYIYIENLKNLLVRNHWTDFHIILQKCSFGDPLPRLFKPFGFVKKHSRQGAGLIFPICLYRKLKKSSCQKPLNRFPYNFAEMFLWWSSTKIVQAIRICQKTWSPGVGLIFPIYLYRKLKKSCQKPLDQLQYNFAEMFLRWSSTKIVQAIWIRQKTWSPGGRGLFSLYIYIENLKNRLVRNHWTDFHIILQKCSFGNPLPRLFKPFGFIKKHGRQGVGLIFPIYLYRNLKKSSCQKPLDRLQYNFAEMFLWWFCTKIVQAIWICRKTWPPRGRAYFPCISL